MTPEFSTASVTPSASDPLSATRTGPPGAPCFTALPTRLESTRARRSGSHEPVQLPCVSIVIARSWCTIASSSTIWRHSGTRSVGRRESATPPPRRIRVTSSSCSIIRPMRRALSTMRLPSAAVSIFAEPLATSDACITIECSGFRRSWASTPMKFSAIPRARRKLAMSRVRSMSAAIRSTSELKIR